MFFAVSIVVMVSVILFGAWMAQAEADFQRQYRISKGLPVPPYVPFMRPGGKEPGASELWRRQDNPEVEAARRRVVKRVLLTWAYAAGVVLLGGIVLLVSS